jgi:thioredoxin reductase (NADPH)
MRLGAHLNAPCEVAGLRMENGFHVIVLTDDSEIPTRAVIVASGARYQRLAVDDLERFEGSGVYYAATDLEARVCTGLPVVVVGGGNSAGQAAIYLAQQGSQVSIAIRRGDLTETMSRYLIDRIEANPRIELLTRTEVREGDSHLDHVTVEHTTTGELRTMGCSGLFCFIGADPATAWLGGAVAPTIALHPHRPLASRRWSGARRSDPLPFETSVPGVLRWRCAPRLAQGVAAAVGEGSSAGGRCTTTWRRSFYRCAPVGAESTPS